MAAPSRGICQFAAVTVYVLAAGWGIHAAVGSVNSPAGWVIPLGQALAAAVWCATDAAVRGQFLVWPARIGILFFWPIGVPAYLVWSRGVRGLGTAAVVAVAWLGVAFTSFMLSGYLAYGSAWFGRPE